MQGFCFVINYIMMEKEKEDIDAKYQIDLRLRNNPSSLDLFATRLS